MALPVALDTGAGDDQGNVGRALPQCILSRDVLFAEMISMIGPEDENGVVFEPGFPEGVQYFPNLCVHKTDAGQVGPYFVRSEEHTSELQSLMRISYAVFCLKKKKQTRT